ncbi:class GN sortase [Oceanibacterium hippocampi]|uniref:Sortase family protein n=1 Tax=Oceanibacterium hippocampi TaxID=745714 RepID=A0A1Y5TDN1_9PROT|nr:class GN sortase [Oceanibacterium hippocampi]SLN57996.1 Sortase family protein [Oceanibacterium hippocampi]
MRAGRAMSGAILTGIALFAGWQVASGVWMTAKARLAQVLLDRAFAGTVTAGAAVRPWPWADIRPLAKLTVPRLGRTAVALDSASGEAMAFGPGHVAGSAQPGAPGLSIFAGHRDSHFAFLRALRAGDAVEVTDGGGRLTRYLVRDTRVVDAGRSGLDPDMPGRWLALATCWPFHAIRPGGPERYVVLAEAVAEAPEPVQSGARFSRPAGLLASASRDHQLGMSRP